MPNYASIAALASDLSDEAPFTGAFAARRSFKSSGNWAVTNATNQLYVGHDATAGVAFYVNTTNLYLSTDHGATFSAAKGLPTGVTDGFSVYRVARFKTMWVMIAKDGSDSNKYKVFTATVATGDTALTWTARHTLATNATNISGSLGVSADGNTLLVSEYTGVANITGGPSIYRSTDGTTWATVHNEASARHFHGVWEDPYNAGTWYALLGDGTATPVLRSTDNGVTFTAVATVGSGWDGVSMSFSSSYIWVTGDFVSGANVAPFYVLNRTGMVPQAGCSNSPVSIPVVEPGTFRSGSVTSGSAVLAMGSIENPLTVDDIGRKLVAKVTATGALLFPSGTTILDVSGSSVTLSNVALASSSAITYTVDRNERYYEFGLYGAVDPTTEIFYLHADSATTIRTQGLPRRYGLFMCRDLFGPLTWVDNLQQGSRLVEVVDGYVISGIHYRPTATASQAV